MLTRHWLAIISIASCASSAWAEEDWSLCPAPAQYLAPQLPEHLPQGAIVGYADRLESQALLGDTENSDQGHMLLSGNVILETHQERLRANIANFNRSSGKISLNGDVQMHSPTMSLFASEGSYQQSQGLGGFKGAQYRLRDRRGNGLASAIQRPNEHLTILDNAVYTTCEIPYSEWAIRTSRLTLDRKEGVGTAKHLRLHLLDTPVFYWPYISFPIDDRRKSGLLYPSFGSSSDNGFEFRQPIYWNIHPQADATLTPRYLAKRGTQLQSEWRYLNRWGDYQFDGEFLEDSQTNTDRWLAGFSHTGTLGHGWSSSISTRRVSDGLYLEDLDSNIGLGKPQHLLSTGSLRYSGSIWRHRIGADRYQTLDTNIALANRPHRREPFLYSNADTLWQGFELNFAGSWINYGHDNNVNGHRLDLYPSIKRTFGTAGWYSTPKLGIRHTQYELQDLTTTSEANPSRTTGIASVDSGLIFERGLNNNRIQTLEPRLYALYVPHEDQSQLPIFDTGSYTFSYAQLFRENRFTGADRQGDTQRLSAGLTTRVIDDNSGDELLSASIGRAYYLDDRQVTLPGTAINTDRASDIAADAQAKISQHWSAGGSLQYSRQNDQVERRTYRLRYKQGNNNIVNLGYRFVRNTLKQTEFSGIWPIGHRWTVVGRWLYDLEDQRSQETFAGFGYQSCCWAMSLVGRRVVDETTVNNQANVEADNQVLLQITLKGLANLGDDNTALLQRGILGYDD